MEPEPDDQLRWLGAAETARRVRSGDLDPVAVAEAAVRRVGAAQPRLNAFQRVADDVAEQASAVAARVAAGEDLPLAGVPLAIKDELAVAGEVHTKGSWARRTPADVTAEVVRRVRAAGAVVVGATRTPELCLTPYTESERGGLTRNPWDPTRTPGGSSGGSAAAVAAGLVPLALGGDGGGSIRGPAAWCGLPGLFATPGRVPTAPDALPWTGMVSFGGFARSVADTALLYDVLLGGSGLRAALEDDFGPARVAVSLDRAGDRPVPQGGPLEPAWADAARRTGDRLAALGHTVRRVPVRFGAASTKFTVRYLVSARRDVRATDRPDLVEPVARTAARLGALLRPALPWALRTGPERRAVETSLDGVDVLVTPTMPCAPPPVGERDGRSPVATLLAAGQRVGYLNPWNLLGWPGLTVPAGVDGDGRPVAALLTARPGREALLLRLGAQLEAAHPWGDRHPAAGS
ncbi:amidase family protein [Lapillicoccus jejuensis]|uniref:Amidase n=1 Tax=Lapillicoccus jejuensis TaxID=402171 RepID=A0A542E3S8_9MICO|nr:amidase family protein [Lapillicoccus jejuensis]TQJ10002.1 amidase [Lapillicoccus jejuensis]